MMESEHSIPSILPPRVDFVFKRLFGDERNKDILCAFLKVMLELPHGELQDIHLLNTELKKEYIEDKHGILDIRVTMATGTQIDIEIQLHNKKDMIARSLFYWSKLYSEQAQEGGDYSSLCRTIAFNILDFNILDADKYHSVYLLQEKESKDLLTDLIQIDFLELPKVRHLSLENSDEKLEWAYFIASEEEEVFSMLADKNKDIEKACDVLKTLSSDPEVRAMYLAREKAIRDYNASIAFAREEGLKKGKEEGLKEGKKEGLREGKKEMIKNLILLGIPMEEIAKVSGFTVEEIHRIKKELVEN